MKLSKTLYFLSIVAIFASSITLWSSIASAEMFLNLGNSPYKNWCLDINGDNGDVIVSPKVYTGCNWSIISAQNNTYQLANLGNSSYKGWFLNVRNDGAVTLEPKPYSGTYWRIDQTGNNIVKLVNLGNSPYKGWVLDISGTSGAVIVSPQQRNYTGTSWLIKPWTK